MEQSTRSVRNDAAMAATILLLGVLLAATGMIIVSRWQESASRRQTPMFDDILGLCATVCGLVTVAWWVAGLLFAVATVLLQRSGRIRGAQATARLSPAFMRRLALAILGLNLVGIPLANAAPDPVEPAWSPTDQSVSTAPAWAPTPAAPEETPDASAGHPESVPLTAGHPTMVAERLDTSSVGSAPAPIEPGWQPRQPVTEPGLLGSGQQRSAEQSDANRQGSVVVQRGDSLWSIAARELGPLASDVEVAIHWPKWYEANRQMIGDDPGHLVPGQILNPPPRS
ncbi:MULTISPECIES: LysM peptidoglycan-binding domain-containing protein [Arthrobacter]|uniref:LysM peptidoglycan-binding domain-containing protein n=1 Tax=Arthrobacter terricola TaxID=2547396 RepID=A0A4R5KDY1_9MICC|nr:MULTISPECIES: LysM peptidoglycan-binding domain-containing protein [Arthrobacter]MBT8162517.1 LysM peptidoglycan-binding domain-containing protein [Arthrobacter sp. GN70]TDF93142.1 LysM peptidoglycan-binding domain-containing protein [Arthrobacter terricola]